MLGRQTVREAHKLLVSNILSVPPIFIFYMQKLSRLKPQEELREIYVCVYVCMYVCIQIFNFGA